MPIFLDTETSGLAPTSGAVILSIGLISDSGQPTSPINELELYITPTPEQWACASEEALKVNGLTYDYMVANGLPLRTAVAQVCTWLAEQRVWLGTDVIGQNTDFDFRFLSYFMGSDLLNAGFPIDRTPINVIEMAKELARHDHTFRVATGPTGRPSYKGTNISKALGLPPEADIHNALAGARACRNNYYALRDRLSNLRQRVRF